MFDDRPDRSHEIVLLGRSNVGKSTIMRELTGRSVPTGRRPGVTTTPTFHDWPEADLLLTDLPGYGFMAGVSEDRREAIKTDIVRYLEDNRDAILVGTIVLDGSAAIEIIDRHSDGGDPPYVLELYHLLEDLGIDPILAVNKLDKVSDRDATMDAIGERFGLLPPWQQWREHLVPIVAKDGDIDALLEALYDHLERLGAGEARGPLPKPHQ